MKRSIIFLTLSAILSIGILTVEVPVVDVTIKDIIEYPYEFVMRNVRVKGTAVPGELGQAGGYYFLVDNYGNRLKVMQTKKDYPGIGQLYAISGIVNFTSDKKEIILTEFQRERWYINGAPIGIDIYILGIIAFGLFGYIVYLLYQMGSRKMKFDSDSYTVEKIPVRSRPFVENKLAEKLLGEIIHLNTPPEETCKLLEGRFLTIKGDDLIKVIRFIRPLKQDAIEYTFGRKDSDIYTEIKLKTPSVATKQATLRNSQDADDYYSDGTYALINHASEEATPTKVNGKSMLESEEIILSEGDKIEMGVVVFAFTKED